MKNEGEEKLEVGGGGRVVHAIVQGGVRTEGISIQHSWNGLRGGAVPLGRGGGVGYLGNWRVISRRYGRGARVSMSSRRETRSYGDKLLNLLIIVGRATFLLALVHLLVSAQVGNHGEVSSTALNITRESCNQNVSDNSFVFSSKEDAVLQSPEDLTYASRQCGCTCAFEEKRDE